MRRFILKILMLAAAMMVVDILVGVVFRHWFERMDDGEMGKENYIGHQVDEDILVFGSSRAEYHYDTKVISELSGRSCYNCGASGNGIILAYGRLLMALQHHRPQLIIYDVNPEFDVLESDNHRSLAQMKIHTETDGLEEVYRDVDALEPFKMLSNMYRFNSNFIHNPLCLFKSAPDRWKPDENHGAVLQKGAFDPMKVREETAPPPFVADSLKLSYVRKFVNLAKGSRLVFVASPKWYAPVDSLRYQPIKDICREMGVEYLDFTTSSKYIHNNELFVDGVHLNAKGAAEFSQDLMKTLTSKNHGEE